MDLPCLGSAELKRSINVDVDSCSSLFQNFETYLFDFDIGNSTKSQNSLVVFFHIAFLKL